MSSREQSFFIRQVEPGTLADDLRLRRLQLHPDTIDGLDRAIGRSVVFLLAMSETDERLGQVGINFNAPTLAETREALGLSPDQSVPNVAFMEVGPPHRKQGIGRALLDIALAQIMDRGHDSAFLTVAPDNERAKALYAYAGFVYTGHMIHTTLHDPNPDGTYGPPVEALSELHLIRFGASPAST